MRDLPLKTEYVLQLGLAPFQLALYQAVRGRYETWRGVERWAGAVEM